MKIVMMGSGGVGGFFGAKLAAGGADVHFVARGKHLNAMRTHGLTIEGPAPLHLAKVQATDDPSSIGPADFVLVGIKLWDTASGIEQIRPIVGPNTCVISFQNGVLKDRYLREAFGDSRIMGGVAYMGTAIDRPGVIRQTGPMQRLLFGEFDGTPSARGQRLLDACMKGGIAAEFSPNIQREIWQKFVFLVGLSGTTTTMRTTIGPIRENAQTRAFLRDVMREVVAVGRAHGIDLPADYAEQRLALIDNVAYDMTSSMHHDLQHGNRLEVRWLSGGVVELGDAVGVPAPLNRAIADILALHASGGAK
ncbi:MAG TPA: 2-dehydropantoate 2-reductase [Micropepsaceae bacterium]|nr:2-dehydropantoate 2-reductase [Micropepsaceae bacterium]